MVAFHLKDHSLRAAAVIKRETVSPVNDSMANLSCVLELSEQALGDLALA